ncbi:ABC-three component system protein [Stenotrophomonas maltophilia]|uniref:ABC-three component system protein n=1 Tax=Stenotrophomonas maltophilia TaxID=40324 RepID=UPI003D7C3818
MSDTILDYVCAGRAEPEPQSKFDVVFVHGLGGDYRSTWTHGNGESWVQWIAEDFPALNVYSAGYDSSVLSGILSGEGATFRDQATMLLDRLINRKSAGRPVFFVTHSLGGLVVKQTLRKSEGAGRERQRRVSRDSLGAAFIATPHQGADFAKCIRTVFKIFLSAVAKELEHGSESLIDLGQWFSQWAARQGIRIECYYETLETKGFMVVDKMTANAHVVGCDPIAVAADHISIVKPETRNAQLYCSIKGVIEDLIEDVSPGSAGGGGAGVTEGVDAFTQVAGHDRRSLADKLKAVGRDHEISRAEERKEAFSMNVQRGIAQASSVALFAEILSNVETRFHQQIGPLISEGAAQSVINGAVVEKVLEPSLAAARASGGAVNIGSIESAMYYLAGNCHIGWDNG